MHIDKRSHLIESDALPLTFGSDGLEPCTTDNPLDLLIQKEEAESYDGLEATAAALSAVRRLFITVFDGGKSHPVDALEKFYRLAYLLDASLVGNQSLEKLAAIFDKTKQAFSYQLLKDNKTYGIRNRNQKSDTAKETYSLTTTDWHKARKQEKEATAKLKQLTNKSMTDETKSAEEKPTKPKQEITPETRAKLSEAAKKRHAAHGGFKKPVEAPKTMAKATEAQTEPKAVEQAPSKRHTMLTSVEDVLDTLGLFQVQKLLAGNHRISISNLDGQASITIDKE